MLFAKNSGPKISKDVTSSTVVAPRTRAPSRVRVRPTAKNQVGLGLAAAVDCCEVNMAGILLRRGLKSGCPFARGRGSRATVLLSRVAQTGRRASRLGDDQQGSAKTAHRAPRLGRAAGRVERI